MKRDGRANVIVVKDRVGLVARTYIKVPTLYLTCPAGASTAR